MGDPKAELVRAVRDLHRPELVDATLRCEHCSGYANGHVVWPCPTIEAVSASLRPAAS